MLKNIPRLLILVALYISPAYLHCQSKSAYGRVVDSYNRELLMDVRVDVLNIADSTLMATTYSEGGIMAFNTECNIAIDKAPMEGGILRLSKDGYYTTYFNLPKIGKSEYSIEFKPIMMNRIPFYNPTQLEEVTVTASKLKMVMKGDTIVYNADAFALPQGSMLDGLISQLPGVELKGNGQIYVNGKFVDELLVNGENFFKGDPKIALENLPAYMVNDVKVYHRNERMAVKPLDELPLVMDVKLKKQYQTGWIANAEAGYGTSNRYLGRLFGLMFTRDSRLSLVANANNTNDDRKPGQTDSWNPNWQTAGRADIAKAGIDYLWNSRLRSWKVETNLMAENKRGDLETQQSTERYLEGGNMFGASDNSSRTRQWLVTTDDKISFHVPRIWVDLKPKASFVREKATDISESTTSDALSNLLNSLDQSSEIYRRQWEAGSELYASWELPQSTNKLENTFSFQWNGRHYESLTNRDLLFPQQEELDEHQAIQEFLPERRLKIAEKLKYGGSFKTQSFISTVYYDIQYIFGHTHLNSTRNYYDDGDLESILPSTYERNLSLVPSKSFHYIAVEDKHTIALNFLNFFKHIMIHGKDHQFNLGLDLKASYNPGHIDYHHDGAVLQANRKPWYVEPKVNFSLGFFTGNYTYESTLCNLLDLIDVTDTGNPLFIYAGNPDLKMGHAHKLYLSSWWFYTKGFTLTAFFNKYENMVAQSAYYNTSTGVTTFRPVNVNGNWDASAMVNFYRRLGSKRKWEISANTNFGYQNSVDIINLEQTTVRNLNLGEKLTLTYKIKEGLELDAKGNVDYRRATSHMADFSTINAVDFDYGLVVRATKLPWNISLTSDFIIHSRRGYSDSRLNDNHLVWNARLAKSIMQGNLTFALDGFDILGQLSNVQLTMNSQGRTEARYNTLPRYAMLHVIYRLNLQPKKN